MLCSDYYPLEHNENKNLIHAGICSVLPQNYVLIVILRRPVMTRSRSSSSVRRQTDIDKENERATFKLRSSDPIDIWMSKIIPQSRKAVEKSKVRVQSINTSICLFFIPSRYSAG